MIYTLIVFALLIAFVGVVAFIRGARSHTQSIAAKEEAYGRASRCLWSLDHEA